MIERSLIEDMFAANRGGGKWDMDGPLLWGYFFTHDRPEPLDDAVPALLAQGYDYVDIFATADEDEGGPERWWPHMEKIEIHSVDSLDQRNRELNAFAAHWRLTSYDGMDVGPVPSA